MTLTYQQFINNASPGITDGK